MTRDRAERGSSQPGQAGLGGLTADQVDQYLRQIPAIVAGVTELRQIVTGRIKRHYTVDEFAKLTGRAPYTVRTWVKSGLIHAVRIEGTGPKGRLLIPREELSRLVDAGRADKAHDLDVGE